MLQTLYIILNTTKGDPDLKHTQFSTHTPNFIKYLVLVTLSSVFIVFGLIVDSPIGIYDGLYQIIVSQDILITDYFVVGGISAAFINAGLLMILSILLLAVLKVDIDGLSLAAVFLMGSFALFGKNPVNSSFVIAGVFLYALATKQRLKSYVHTALLSTCIAPMVTEVLFIIDLPLYARLFLSIMVGASFGFLTVPLSAHLAKVHHGLTLYNIGFTVGILGTIYFSIFRSFGYVSEPRLLFSSGNNHILLPFLITFLLLMFILGYILNHNTFLHVNHILSFSCRGEKDFQRLETFGVALMNIALNGAIATAYVLFVKGPLNGPTIGGILTVAGFGAYGKHFRNILPIFIGVYLGNLTNISHINDPGILFAALFGTALAPITDRYGWFFGMVAGYINSAVVLNSGLWHGGMNLYNTGFSSGLVATVMAPILETFFKRREHC